MLLAFPTTILLLILFIVLIILGIVGAIFYAAAHKAEDLQQQATIEGEKKMKKREREQEVEAP